MSIVTCLGVDPGTTGCLACVKRRVGDLAVMQIDLLVLPQDDLDILEWLTLTRTDPDGLRRFTVVERVSGWAGTKKNKDGEDFKHQGQPGHTMFDFGKSYGRLCMAISACASPLEKVEHIVPRSWQKMIRVQPTPRTDPGAYGRHKNQLKQIALRLYPHHRKYITLKTCDALLMAYCAMEFYKEAISARFQETATKAHPANPAKGS